MALEWDESGHLIDQSIAGQESHPYLKKRVDLANQLAATKDRKMAEQLRGQIEQLDAQYGAPRPGYGNEVENKFGAGQPMGQKLYRDQPASGGESLKWRQPEDNGQQMDLMELGKGNYGPAKNSQEMIQRMGGRTPQGGNSEEFNRIMGAPNEDVQIPLRPGHTLSVPASEAATTTVMPGGKIIKRRSDQHGNYADKFTAEDVANPEGGVIVPSSSSADFSQPLEVEGKNRSAASIQDEISKIYGEDAPKIEDPKQASGVDDLIAAVLIKLGSTAAGYALGGIQGGASGAEAGDVGIKYLQDSRAKQETRAFENRKLQSKSDMEMYKAKTGAMKDATLADFKERNTNERLGIKGSIDTNIARIRAEAQNGKNSSGQWEKFEYEKNGKSYIGWHNNKTNESLQSDLPVGSKTSNLQLRQDQMTGDFVAWDPSTGQLKKMPTAKYGSPDKEDRRLGENLLNHFTLNTKAEVGSIQAAAKGLELLNKKNPLADSAVQYQLSRLAQGVGVVTDKDLAASGASKALVEKYDQLMQQLSTGQASDANVGYYRELFKLYYKRASADLNSKKNSILKGYQGVKPGNEKYLENITNRAANELVQKMPEDVERIPKSEELKRIDQRSKEIDAEIEALKK